jgi:hypothetical protein
MFKVLDSAWVIHQLPPQLSKFSMIITFMVKAKFLIAQMKKQMIIASKLTNKVSIQDK